VSLKNIVNVPEQLQERNKLRIFLYTRVFQMAGSGAENYAVRLCKALAERRHEVHVIADHISAIPGIVVHQDTSNIDRVRDHIKPDLTVDWGFIHHADIHRMGGGVHECFMQYSLYAYHGLNLWYKRMCYRSARHQATIRRQRELLRHPEAVFLANSLFTAKQAIAAGASKTAVSVLHNGVDTALFRPKTLEQHLINLRASWGLSSDDVAVVFVAHNLRLKNVSLLRRVFSQLAISCPQLKLVIVGKHRPLWLPKNCVYAGKQEDMTACYQAADCMVHPTFFDSCANVVLEAMSSGLPVVVSDVCGANELVQDGKSGFVLSINGPANVITSGWEQQLRVLGDNAALREQIGADARNAMLDNDFMDYVTRFEKFMKKTISSKVKA
jgi:UDP-glucose:(heptosyl)LPS alpha-1,3-glucosyltransferase